MPSSVVLRRVALVRNGVSEELIASIIKVTSMDEVGTLAVTSNRCTLRGNTIVTGNFVPSSPILVTLMMEAVCFSEASVLTRATQRNIADDDILHSRRCEDLKSYIALTGWAL
jgi:hypothetical protein